MNTIYTHIYPVNDTYNHNIESTNCWCSPKIDKKYMLVIHNSFDGREGFEEIEDIC